MLTSKDIADALHVSEQTVRAYARDGVIPFVTTPGGHRRFDLGAVRLALAMAERRKFDPLGTGSSSSFVSTPERALIGVASHMKLSRPFAEDGTGLRDHERPLAEIPFIGVRGTSRFVLEGASAVRR